MRQKYCKENYLVRQGGRGAGDSSCAGFVSLDFRAFTAKFRVRNNLLATKRKLCGMHAWTGWAGSASLSVPLRETLVWSTAVQHIGIAALCALAINYPRARPKIRLGCPQPRSECGCSSNTSECRHRHRYSSTFLLAARSPGILGWPPLSPSPSRTVRSAPATGGRDEGRFIG